MASVFVALGTNLGDRAANLNRAIAELNTHAGKVERTSLLYTTAPQYVTDQPQFLNAVLELRTSLTPINLLLCFKDIEVRVGRDLGSLRYGPRILDVDILFYGSEIHDVNTVVGPLIVPHKLIAERDFVLRPLLDIAEGFIHPTLGRSIRELYDALDKSTFDPPVPVLNLGRDVLWMLHAKTYVMGIVNVTTNSFSGDGTIDVDAAVVSALSMIDSGCDILDIGGESTQPNAPPVAEEDEIKRVVPVIQAIRNVSPTIPISIDTTKAAVAKAAIEAGANLVNDVSAGTRDADMLATVSRIAVPIVMMHMRGTPDTMTNLKKYEDIVEDVVVELSCSINKAVNAGIPTWNIIADPGIGFAKGIEENLKLLRRVGELKKRLAPMPLLIGASRKKFLGTICNKPNAVDRALGTAATCAAAIVGGADIVRVHDVAVCLDVCKVSDAIWRPASLSK